MVHGAAGLRETQLAVRAWRACHRTGDPVGSRARYAAPQACGRAPGRSRSDLKILPLPSTGMMVKMRPKERAALKSWPSLIGVYAAGRWDALPGRRWRF
jgi:hypothetical protein